MAPAPNPSASSNRIDGSRRTWAISGAAAARTHQPELEERSGLAQRSYRECVEQPIHLEAGDAVPAAVIVPAPCRRSTRRGSRGAAVRRVLRVRLVSPPFSPRVAPSALRPCPLRPCRRRRRELASCPAEHEHDEESRQAHVPGSDDQLLCGRVVDRLLVRHAAARLQREGVRRLRDPDGARGERRDVRERARSHDPHDRLEGDRDREGGQETPMTPSLQQ